MTMINTVKIISSTIESGRRILKFLRMGNKDVQTSKESMPFGIDSNPVQDMVAIYAKSGIKGKNYIIGYINKNQIAGIGESRIYSTNQNGEEQIAIYLTNTGDIEIGGNSDFLARFSELKKGFDEFKQNYNDFLTKYNTHTHPVSGSATGPTSGPSLPSTASIDAAKIDNIKTK